MRRILFTFLLCLTAGSALLTACRHADDAWMAQRQALFRLIVSVHNSGQEEIACKLDSLNRTALPADRHARALWQLVQAWLTASQTNRGIDDSLLLPVVDYLTQHGAPGEQVEALLLHARSLEWRGEMEQAQHTYSQALQVALKSGDPHTEMRCRQLLTSFYLQRTHLKDEGAQTARRFLQLAELWRTCTWGASTSRPYTKTRSTTARKKAWSTSAKPQSWPRWPKINTWRCRANMSWAYST